MNELKLVVFDLAGTTVKDNGQVTGAFAAALAPHGIAVTPEQLAGVRGASKREAVLGFIPDGPDRSQRAQIVYTSFREHLTQRYRTGGVEPVEGVEEIFRRLRDKSVCVALNTGFDRDVTELLLSALRWDQAMVDAVVCGDEVQEGRPAPFLIFRAMEKTRTMSVHEVANVGDTVLDLAAGHNAGVRWNVGVLSGAHDRRRLEAAPHTHLIGSVADLFSALDL